MENVASVWLLFGIGLIGLAYVLTTIFNR